MGLFDIFKGKTKDSADNSNKNTVGWDAIENELKKVYGDQKAMHYSPEVYYSLGGNDPLDGLSIYYNKSTNHYHYVTYGFTELYDKESEILGQSGWGFELTFRLKANKEDGDYPTWPLNLLKNIALTTFNDEILFDEYHTLNSGPLRESRETEITGILFVKDPQLTEQESQNGKFKFLQIVGLTEEEYSGITSKAIDRREFISNLSKSNPLLITDIDRK